jgi:pyridoxamine 5'-phosphate oxidase
MWFLHGIVIVHGHPMAVAYYTIGLRFLGFDFGRLAALDWDGRVLHLAKLGRHQEPQDILEWIESAAGRDAIVAVNTSVTRPLRISEELLAHGFRRGEKMRAKSSGRHHIEVDLAAAVIQLFEGKPANGLCDLVPRLPAAELSKIPPDHLDAVLCAYLAAHWWCWGRARNDVQGHVIAPQRHTPEVKLADLREEYKGEPFDESHLDPNPMIQFQKWFSEARAVAIHEPNAMTLATAGKDGQPSARIVLLKEVREDSFVFYTNYRSQKGRELAENPHAGLVFYWPALGRQVRIAGGVKKTTRAEAERYFHTRPSGAQLGAWASRQSAIIASRENLEQRVRELQAEFDGKTIPLPPDWGGYRLYPDAIEFWQGRENRLHDRLRYTKEHRGRWKIERLAP